ncbi:MAG TPA: sigma-70 family RNA polymerase sigma factor [Caulobacterales bacterium]|nr:sigma-70 family RNA polymerase sigma factor [Caulobacterales bacterium]
MAVNGDSVRRELTALLPRLRRFGRSLTRNADEADDLVQTALERALRNLDAWTPGTRLDAWMFRIMKNAWIDEVRSRSVRARVLAPEEEGANVGADGASAMETHLEAQRVRAAMEQLPEDQRLAVALVLVEGLSYREAADMLDVPIGTLTSRLARGRAAIEAQLAGPGGNV